MCVEHVTKMLHRRLECLRIPCMPFESVCSDFFQLFATFGDGGQNLLLAKQNISLNAGMFATDFRQPYSNGRAELGVKSMKRLLRDNIGPGAILTHCNKPDLIS